MNKYVSILLIFFSACTTSTKNMEEQNTQETNIQRLDEHSFSVPKKVIVKHLDLNLNVDFKNQILSGVAHWGIDNISKTDEIIFDTYDLEIEKVTLDQEDEEAFFVLGDKDKILGQALSVQIKPETKKVHIFYKTSKSATALQWLNPQQTADKKHPFLFTQSEAILARSWIPCQDSPAIRFTYNAEIKIPNYLLALMSAENPHKKNELGIYHFKQLNPIPSYLMALSVGDIEFKAIDKRCGVYAEPSLLNKAVNEFADMGKMVNSAEELYGNYRWGRYDVLVLPPSFPFGGMENPRLTFATPTIIAGDKSLVSLIAHELAHSWSGNLVTNATWNDFWLNEGFTNYFERRIVEKLYGVDTREMQEVLAFNDLLETVNEMGKTNPDTRLKVDFNKRNPDDGVSPIPYEKGYFFLKGIENAIGREKFDEFIKSYFNGHAFKCMTTDAFLEILNQQIIKNDTGLKEKINVYGWIYQPGLPKEFAKPQSKKLLHIDSLQKKWREAKIKINWANELPSADEKIYFIQTLPQDISTKEMETLDQILHFTQSGNAEIQTVWYALSASKNYTFAYPQLESFLLSVGRRKFIIPIYKALLANPKTKQKALDIYKKARPNYHSVAFNTLDEIVK